MTDTLSQAAIGRAMGLAPATMTKLKKLGMPVTSVEAAVAWRYARQNVAARKPLPPGAEGFLPAMSPSDGDTPQATEKTESFDSARLRKEIADANAAEIKEKRLRGELLPLDQAVRASLEIGRQVRDALNAAKRRVSPYLAASMSVTECEEILEREHKAIQDNLVTALTKSIKSDAVDQ